MSRKFSVNLLLIVMFCITPSASAHDKRRLVVNASIIAYDESASLVNITSAIQIEVFIVRIKKIIKGQEKMQYIKVVYQHMHKEQNLPAKIYDSHYSWQFSLVKAATNKVSCKGPLKHLKPTLGAENEKYPEDITLPCYILRPGDVKNIEKG